MTSMKVVHVVGARPNFMKIAPVYKALRAHAGVVQLVVHTGQHYDHNMSHVFFEQLGLPEPDVNLGVGSGSHAAQTAQVMVGFEPVVLEHRPDWVLVYGDVNSTVAAALVCSKLLIPISHVEAGLRSGDRTMPEEINRLLTDQMANLLFTPSQDGNDNLAREERINMVGNVMIDTLIRQLAAAEAGWPLLQKRWALGDYVLATLHRPSNVDDPAMLEKIVKTLEDVGSRVPVLLPIHPRTRQRLAAQGLLASQSNVRIVEPLGYHDFLALQAHARLVITDSGGIQEETTYMGVPCITVRANTERPITVTLGTNVLVGQDMARLTREAARVLDGAPKPSSIPPLWDGHAGERIANVLVAAGR